jgi:hypothetical protein
MGPPEGHASNNDIRGFVWAGSCPDRTSATV